MMTYHNGSTCHPITFFLIGIPGLEEVHGWISMPFCSVHLVALLGNVTILLVIKMDQTLREPMFYFLAIFSTIDLALSTTSVPRMLDIFWFNAHEINFGACVAQMFLIHAFTGIEAGVLVAMAFDYYVAICAPLHYTTILTSRVLMSITLYIVIFTVLLTFSMIYLIYHLPFLPGSCNNTSFLLRAHGNCKTVLWKHPCQWYLWALCGLCFSPNPVPIGISYVYILRAVFLLPSQDARLKALSTCASRIAVLCVFYIPSLFSFLSHRFGHNIPHYIHILVVSLYLVIPPSLNPIIYGVRTKQIWGRVFHMLLKNKTPTILFY